MTFDKYKSLLRGRLTEKRYIHSLGVADAAATLARIYGADENDMYTAGLLHDMTKNINDEGQLKYLRDSGIILSDTEKASPSIWHAVTASVAVQKELGIKNQDIISAIRYHTTAKACMTLQEKIIYIADLVSADRCYDDVEMLRDLVKKDLDGAILYALRFTIGDLAQKNMPIHPDTLNAYNYLLINKKRG